MRDGMGLFDFLRAKPVNLEELEPHLREVSARRRKAMSQLRKLSHKRDTLIERARKARKDGDNIELDYIWQELKSLRTDVAYIKRDAKVATLEEIALKRYFRGLKRLKERGDTASMLELFRRLRESGLEAKLQKEEIDERAYMDELNAILSVVSEEVEALEEEEDEEKEAFLRELDKIIETEEKGKTREAKERKERLSRKLEEGELGVE
ncbi:MAG: hypothetical protein N2234_05355 [Planctomycetota bacterium]|nr:hypothetical protein [Planctomycetota bacterium]